MVTSTSRSKSMDLDSKTLKTLTVAVARKLVKNQPDWIILNGLTRISDKVAEVLGSGAGSLYLEGLSDLSPRAAAALARRKWAIGNFLSPRKFNDLLLNGLPSISVETAEALAGYEGYLMLDGLAQLSDDVAAALAKFKGTNLDLDGLQILSNKGLATLAAAGMERLSFGFKSISEEQAEILSAYKGALGLDVHRLSAPVAAILGRRKGRLGLECLRALPADVARGLARHRGALDLNGLERISAKAAWQLARHKGDLELCGVEKLSRAAAKALATVKWAVELHGLETITPGVLAELAKRPEKLLLSITTLTDGVAKVLSRWPRPVSIYSVTDLTDRQIGILLPMYAARRLILSPHARQKMETALREARNRGRRPFRANKKKRQHAQGAHRADKERRA